MIDNKPITFSGKIPFNLPFSKVKSTEKSINFNLDIPEQPLEIINLVTKNTANWIGGTGNIKLTINGLINPSGTIDQLTANGEAQINNATIQSTVLPENLTNLNGKIYFDFDRLIVETLKGRLSNGQISAQGVLPINNPLSFESYRTKLDSPINQLTGNECTLPNVDGTVLTTLPLQLCLNKLRLNIKDKYSGLVNGGLIITGDSLTPKISGQLNLSQGQVTLPNNDTNTTDNNGDESNNNPIQFNNLKINLGDNLEIISPPTLNFIAQGDLTLNGNLNEPRPEGKLTLPKGYLNLFTTRLKLANNYPHTAEFFPSTGAEPIVNLKLTTKTLETTRNPLARRPTGNEIIDDRDLFATNLGSVQTIQIDARVDSVPASQIQSRLELTSNPPRTQPEIILLLGGGLLETLGQGDGDLGLGLANLAGSAFFNNIQSLVEDTLGLGDFRLFPTVTQDEKGVNSTLGLAAEIGIDLSPQVSTSVFKVLTSTELPQYGLRYRLNEQLLLRGSTNFFGESRSLVEFEQRF